MTLYNNENKQNQTNNNKNTRRDRSREVVGAKPRKRHFSNLHGWALIICPPPWSDWAFVNGIVNKLGMELVVRFNSELSNRFLQNLLLLPHFSFFPSLYIHQNFDNNNTSYSCLFSVSLLLTLIIYYLFLNQGSC